MPSAPISPRDSLIAKVCLVFLAFSLVFSNVKSMADIMDATETMHVRTPLLVFEKNNTNKLNASELISIYGNTNGIIIIDGPSQHHIHFSSEGLIIEEIFDINNKTNTKNFADGSLTNRPITLTIDNLVFLDDSGAENTQELIKEQIPANESKIPAYRIYKAGDNPLTNPDPKKNKDSTKEPQEERIYSMGHSKIIFRIFPDSKETEIEFVDERISIRIEHDNSGDDPDENPGIMAGYFDEIAVNPAIQINNAEDLIERIDIPDLNQDTANIRKILLNELPPGSKRLADALNLMHPGKFADLDIVIFNNHSLLYSNICRHFEELCCCINTDCKLNVWGKGFGNFQTRKTDNYITGYNSSTSGMFVGVDCCPVNGLCFGSGFAFTYDEIKWQQEEANALAQTYYGFLYSSLTCGCCFLQAIGSLSYSSIEANRFVVVSPVLQRKANHDNHAWTYGGRLNGGVNFCLPCRMKLQVYDAIDLGNVEDGAFIEGGAGALNLQVNKRSSLHLRNELGVQVSRNFTSPCNTSCWTPAIGLSWVYQNLLSGNHMTSRLQNQQASFTVATRSGGTNQISPKVSITGSSCSGIYLSAFYDGMFGSGWSSNEFSVHMGKRF